MASVVDLRRRPDLLDTLADRITAAFWAPSDRTWIADGLREHLSRAEPLPCALLAVDEPDGRYRGSALVIPNDLDERPDLTPWLAALWVDEDARERGIGALLVEAAISAAADAGVSCLYLASRRGREAFYGKRGWRLLETEVGRHRLSVMKYPLNE